MINLSRLEKSIENLSLLYVENNSDFRKIIYRDLNRTIKPIFVAKNIDEGFGLFKKHHSKIVVIDVEFIHCDWVGLARYIKRIKPETKIIIFSKFSDNKYLYEAIEIGVTKYILKPVEAIDFFDSLDLVIESIKKEYERRLFYATILSRYNNKNLMILMLEKNNPVLANQNFLDFFDVEIIDEFNTKYKNLGALFLGKDSLIAKNKLNWIDDIITSSGNLYHTKLKNTHNEEKSFLLKYNLLDKNSGYSIVSFENVTDVNLNSPSDKKISIDGTTNDALINLLELIYRDKITIQLSNYYKGVTIVHDAIIDEFNKKVITLRTSSIQQKAIHIEGQTLITSKLLPASIICNTILINNFDTKIVKVKDFKFILKTPIERKSLRLSAENKYMISLFIQDRRYHGDTTIEDVSLDSVKLHIDQVPSILNLNDEVILDMVFDYKNKPLIINTKATIFKKTKNSLICLFKLDDNKRKLLSKYMLNRQINIIKEFKKLK